MNGKKCDVFVLQIYVIHFVLVFIIKENRDAYKLLCKESNKNYVIHHCKMYWIVVESISQTNEFTKKVAKPFFTLLKTTFIYKDY